MLGGGTYEGSLRELCPGEDKRLCSLSGLLWKPPKTTGTNGFAVWSVGSGGGFRDVPQALGSWPWSRALLPGLTLPEVQRPVRGREGLL